jgi:hypothetical protein
MDHARKSVIMLVYYHNELLDLALSDLESATLQLVA